MSKTMNDFYEEVLDTAGASVDEVGFIGLFDEDEPTTIEIEGEEKRLAIPTNDILSKHYKETYRFHPLAEDPFKGPSKLLEEYQQWVVANLNITLTSTIVALLDMCASEKLHSKLNPVQSELLRIAKNAKERTVQSFIKIIDKIDPFDPKEAPVHIFLKQKPTLNNRKYKWGGIVTFPLYELIKNSDKKILNVVISQENTKTLLDVFEYLFPHLNEVNYYSYGSDSNTAPKFEALLGAVRNVAIEVNNLIEELGNQSGTVEPIPLDWLDDLENTDKFIDEIRMIPLQPGNEGKHSKLDPNYINLGNESIQTPTEPTREKEVMKRAKVTKEAVSLSDALGRNNQPPQPMQAQYTDQPMYPQQGYPQQVPHQVPAQQHQQAAVQQPQADSSGGTDLRTLLGRNNDQQMYYQQQMIQQQLHPQQQMGYPQQQVYVPQQMVQQPMYPQQQVYQPQPMYPQQQMGYPQQPVMQQGYNPLHPANRVSMSNPAGGFNQPGVNQNPFRLA